MQLLISGKNFEVSDWMRTYVEKKLGKLDRYLPGIDEARVELSLERTKDAKDSQVCQVTLRTKGSILRAEERAGDLRDAVDRVVEKINRQITRYKGKRDDRLRGVAEPSEEEFPSLLEEVEEDEEPIISRRKRFTVSPMNEQEAVEQMVLLGHDFFLFYNADESAINVVYRRKDGKFGLLQPDLA